MENDPTDLLRSNKTDALPLRLFIVALLITLLTILWAGFTSVTRYYDVTQTQSIPADTHHAAHRIHIHMYIIMAAALVLLALWYYTLRRIRWWRNQLIITRQQERKQRVFLDTLLENMPLSIFAKDVRDDYKLVLINRRGEETLAVPREKLIGTTDYDHWPREEADFFRSIDQQVMKERKVVEIDAEPVTTPRGTFTAHTLKVPIYDEAGNPTILLGILDDVTDKIKAQQDLRQAKTDAERANQAKSDFLAKMSHELRTPLNSILGLSRMLIEDGKMGADQRDMANTIYKSATNLLEIVNDILDISKIEAGGIVLENIGFDFMEMIDSVANAMAPVASAKGVSLHYATDAVVIPYVKGDPFRLGRVLTNLVSNAIKYSCNTVAGKENAFHHGIVSMTVDSRATGQGTVDITCRVTDNGIGIATDKLNIIFDKFTQADESITRRYGGTGLGLTITRELIEMMGGTLGVESTLGKGSTFWFTIPFTIAPALETPVAMSTPTLRPQGLLRRGKRLPADQASVLVAEDHLLNQDFVRRLLMRMGFGSVDIVDDGIGVLQASAVKAYDIILMDCHMPRKNGYDTTIEIRAAEEHTDRHVPIIALTADAMKGTEERCFAAGMDAYVKKPIDPDILQDVMEQWISFAPAAAASTVTAPAGAKGPANTTMLEKYARTPEDIRRFISLFTAQSEEIITLMHAHIDDADTPTWKEAAHKFKGGAGTVGAEALRRIANDAEQMAANDDRAGTLAAMTAEYERVKAFLQKKYF